MATRMVAVVGASTVAAAAVIAVTVARRHTSFAQVEAVLSFWFDGDTDSLYDTRWFVAAGGAAQTALDEEVRLRFGSLLASAMRGHLDHWRRSPRSCLALIVLLDQFSRHAHRGQRTLIDAADRRALQACTELLQRNWDREMTVAQLVFSLMPLRHQPSAERLEDVM